MYSVLPLALMLLNFMGTHDVGAAMGTLFLIPLACTLGIHMAFSSFDSSNVIPFALLALSLFLCGIGFRSCARWQGQVSISSGLMVWTLLGLLGLSHGT